MGISSDLRKTNSLSIHHYNHQQGGGLPRKRLQSQSSMMNKSPNNSNNPQLLRTKSMTSDSLKVGVELNEYQLYGTRRKSTYFTSGSSSSFNDNDNDTTATTSGDTTDYKAHFRRTLLQMYAETGGARARNTEQYADLVKKRQEQQRMKKNRQVGEKEAHHNRLYLFIKYIATEQELLLQLFIFFPLILTSLYILFVEEKPLFTIP